MGRGTNEIIVYLLLLLGFCEVKTVGGLKISFVC